NHFLLLTVLIKLLNYLKTAFRQINWLLFSGIGRRGAAFGQPPGLHLGSHGLLRGNHEGCPYGINCFAPCIPATIWWRRSCQSSTYPFFAFSSCPFLSWRLW